MQRIVAKLGKFSDVDKVTPHDLRRTVVTEFLDRGLSQREISTHAFACALSQTDTTGESPRL